MTHVGKKLREYTLTRHIGSGGVAEVWMAERTRMGLSKTVAIKLLSAAAREHSENRRMFLEEARLSMLLSHSSIIQVFDADECGGECFIAMEWVDGVNLAQLCAALWETGERLPLHVSTYIIGELIRALDYGHNFQTAQAASIVHRDVSPQNVMLSVAGEVKLMDFGVARFATDETTGDFVKGKLRYMPPEQLRGDSGDPRVDLFAVGAILHEMIEGRRFRNTDNPVELVAMIEGGEVPRLSDLNAVPAAIRQLLYGLLDPDQARRMPDARTALQMLSQWRGYENAAIELQDLVLRFKHLCQRRGSDEGPRTGAAQARAAVAARVLASREGAQRGRGQASQWYPSSRFNLIAAPIIAALGLAIGISSVAHALSTTTILAPRRARLAWLPSLEIAHAPGPVAPPADQPAEPVQTLEIVEPPPTPTLRPEPALPPADPEPPEPLPPETGSDVETDQPGQLTDDPTPPEPDEEATDTPVIDRVKVHVMAHTFRSAYVKIGGRKLTAQPVKQVWLRVGAYNVHVRTTPDDPWRKIGRIKLRPDHRYEVKLVKPNGLEIVERR